jgi:hypothetical protein
MPDQYDSYTSDMLANPENVNISEKHINDVDMLANPDQITNVEISANQKYVTFDYIVKNEAKTKTLDQETLMFMFELQDDKEQDPHHYVPKKKREK